MPTFSKPVKATVLPTNNKGRKGEYTEQFDKLAEGQMFDITGVKLGSVRAAIFTYQKSHPGVTLTARMIDAENEDSGVRVWHMPNQQQQHEAPKAAAKKKSGTKEMVMALHND